MQTMLIATCALAQTAVIKSGVDANIQAPTSPVTSTKSTTPAVNSPGGLFVGAYIEDAVANPEDPTAGLLYLNLPDGQATFAGLMNFTFVGCQTKSYGVVKGDKKRNELRGTWDGKLDNTTQSGGYEGAYNAEEKYYAGTYNVKNGKQFVHVPNCIQYYVSPRGTWLLLAPNQTFSTAKKYQALDLVGLTVTWQVPPNSLYGSISIIDKEIATAKLNPAQMTGNTQNAIVFTQMLAANQTSYSLPNLRLKSGKTYVLSVIYANNRAVTYASNKEFRAH
ncbi:MAG: hypothetical protein WBP13_05755 [Methylophilaceae bacterium]